VVALLGLIWAGILPNPFRRLPEQKHLAVLPFQTIGNDTADQAFSDGVVESLTSKLSQLERFHKSFWVFRRPTPGKSKAWTKPIAS
jgi:TolB-like protein